MSASAVVRQELPFLGLHYFDEENQHLFFGRDEQLRDLLAKLAESRCVTVIGSSGTGKSSLCRAGLLPALRAGFLRSAGSDWRIIKTRPGISPIRNLAEDLETVFSRGGTELTLRRGPLGLVEAARQCGLRDGQNLLIMVDQFEEIFRYQREAPDPGAAAEEASAFVKLLLEASARVEPAIFVLITMRSDYLGACAQFRDLPERINTGLYLVPRMRRDQLEEAITGPAAVAGAGFSPALVQKLLNDAGEDPDQLPVVQHALLRAWLNWQREDIPEQPIDFRHYEATGGVKDGLDNHAEEIYCGLDQRQRRIAEILFRCLTERDPSNNDIRRPTQLGVIAAIAGVPVGEVREVADAFRREGASFLTPTPPAELHDDTLIDITHESLIRKWRRLCGSREYKGWVQEEAGLREQYRDLVKRARRAQEKRQVLTGEDLNEACGWRNQDLRPEWGLRYEPAPDSFALVCDYIERSVKARNNWRIRRRLYFALSVVAVIVSVALAEISVSHRRERAELYKDAIAAAKIKADALGEFSNQLKDEAKNATDAAKRATVEAARAREFQILATARQLSSQAQGLKDRDSLELSALLALESLKRKSLPEATAALRGPMELLARPLWTKDVRQAKSSGKPDLGAVAFSADSYPLLQYSADGRYLARVTSDSKMHLYESARGREIPLQPMSAQPDSLAWDENQLYVLAGTRLPESGLTTVIYAVSLDGSVKQILQKRCTGLCLLTPNGKYFMVTSTNEQTSGQLYPLNGGPPLSLAEAGKIRAVNGEGEVLREAADHKGPEPLLAFFDSHNNPHDAEGNPSQAFDLGGNSGYLAVTGQNRAIRIFREQPQWKHVGQVVAPSDPTALALSPDGRLIAIADEEGGVTLLDWAVQSRLAAWSHSSPVIAIAFNPRGGSIASMDASGELRVLPIPTELVGNQGRVLSTPSHEKIAFEDLGFGSNFTASFAWSERFLLIRGDYWYGQIFDADQGKPVLPDQRASRTVALSPDSNYAASIDAKGQLTITDLTGSSSAITLNGPGSAVEVAVSPGGRYVAVGLGSKGVSIADVAQRSFLDPSPLPKNSALPVFSPDGRWLIVAQPSSKSFNIVRCGTWTVAHHADFNSRFSTLFSSDGRFVFLKASAVGGRNSRSTPFLLIDTEDSMKERKPAIPTGANISAVQFSPDGHLLAIATVDDRMVRVFDPRSGMLVRQIAVDSPVTALVFSHSAHYLATASDVAAPRVFDLRSDLRSGLEVSRMVLDEKEIVLALHFSRDDRSLVVASRLSGGDTQRSAEIVIKRQSLFPEDLIREGCARVSRNLTLAEWKTYLPDYPYPVTCKDLPAAVRSAHQGE